MTCDPHWTAYVTAIAAPIVAVIAAYIAYRQSEIARNKLKLDLFERRMTVYEAVRKTLGKAVTSGALSFEDEIQYHEGTRSAKWLFGEDVSTYLEKDFWPKLNELNLHVAMMEGADPKERSHHATKKAEVLRWFNDQYDGFDQVCRKYLILEH